MRLHISSVGLPGQFPPSGLQVRSGVGIMNELRGGFPGLILSVVQRRRGCSGVEAEVSLSAQEGLRLPFLVRLLTDFVSPRPPRRPGRPVFDAMLPRRPGRLAFDATLPRRPARVGQHSGPRRAPSRRAAPSAVVFEAVRRAALLRRGTA